MKIKFLGHLKNILGREVMVLSGVNGKTLRDILLIIYNSLGEISSEIFYGSPNKLRSSILLLVNDAVYDVVGGLDYIVNEDDELTFIPIIHGG
ncbi:MAG: ubiquitin-related modifier 1 [Candidatus Methanomethylicia archaeon]|nr:ubiquitin-related modifier 1 [Candidatus Methanomethylicia archaeon]MCX8168935.1 ubiquitin-related modifier 1 [Candidatus Methanomethylicia archaeon]MDW7988667.1 MoaD/ThiS family protein [Nitrososphaerota archaeon]